MSGIHWGPASYNSTEEVEEEVKREFNQLGPNLKLGDQRLLKEIAAYSAVAARELEAMGIYWKRYPDGKLATTGPATLYPVACQQGETGPRVMDVLLGEVMRRPIDYKQQVIATSLLMSDGQCVGSTAIDIPTGKFIAVKAKAVILATGHAGGYLWRFSTATRDCVGSGVLMAYDVGAEIVNLEFQQWHSHDNAVPESARRLVHHAGAVFDHQGAQLVTKEGRSISEEIEAKAKSKDLMHNPSATRMVAETYGRREALRVSYRHLDKKWLDEFYYQHPVLEKFGYDVTKDTIPVGTNAHTTAGGVRIDLNAESTVPGLYAAGGATGVYPTVTSCLWAGNAAAVSASARAKTIPEPRIDNDQLAAEKLRVTSFLRPRRGNEAAPAHLKRIIRDVMWDGMWYLKSQQGMEKALAELRQIRQEVVPNMGLESLNPAYNTAWIDSLDVVSMLDLCELIILASLMRKESRGCFQRLDYPDTDDKDWFKRIVIRRKGGIPDLHTEAGG